jgi:alpha-ketoglutarate-dependent taurine dioxygenase
VAKLEIRQLTPSVGAEIIGFNPRGEIDDATWQVLSKTFDDRGVLVFRDIDLDTPMQHRIAEVLQVGGDLSKAKDENSRQFSLVSNKEPGGGSPYGRLLFHSDMMWSDVADQVATLYALDAAQPPTPTVFTSTTYAWRTLPEDLRARVKDARARHQSGQQGRGNSAYEEELIQPKWNTLFDTATPVALPHPRTGQVMLYVGEQHTREIVGLPKEQSDELLDALFAHLYRPEHLLEHHWRTGDLVVWDNQATQHGRPYVTGDGPARTLRKIHAPSDAMARYGAKPTYDKKAS